AAEEKAARAAGEKAAKAAAEKMSGAAGEKAVRAAEEKTARVPAEKPAKPAPKVDEEAVKKAAKEFLEQVFGAMGMEVSIESVYNPGERELQVMMNGGDMGILIGKRGQTLDSLQYLVSLVVNKETEGYLRVKLDTENYRERRRETLETLAKNIAYKVKRTKHPVSLEPMNPYERRIIHSALQNDRYVVTRSEGEDPYRHVVISLKRDSGGNGRRERYGSSRKDKGRADRSEEKQPEVLAEAASDTEA
ncbi:MAG: RNA-binding cell elongation regulator Jag/EloR, partial [Eubacteriales bacterium]|nr:RNA-binding cell elongation regulator Jag/EloR [Eubacteriales bacterium]